jgi:hypothetical protein
MTNPEDIKKLVSEITDFVNSFSADEKQFIAAMSTEHRTLQQSFTRLVLKWVEHVGGIDYRYDDRNKASHMTCNEILQSWLLSHENIRPSNYLPHI